MTLVTQAERQLISAHISAVERVTDAELVAVLAPRADHYAYVPTLWAAALALLTPGVLALLPPWLGLWDVLLAQWVVFVVAALLFRWPPILFRLIPARLKRSRAALLARSQFLEQNLHRTRDSTGVLIFVSEAEHYVEIIADIGIDRHVGCEQWQRIVDGLVECISAGKTATGYIECIKACGELLQRHVPVTSQKNELPNRMIVLD